MHFLKFKDDMWFNTFIFLKLLANEFQVLIEQRYMFRFDIQVISNRPNSLFKILLDFATNASRDLLGPEDKPTLIILSIYTSQQFTCGFVRFLKIFTIS